MGDRERVPTEEEQEARRKRVDVHKTQLARIPAFVEFSKDLGFGDDILRFEDTLIKTVFPRPKNDEPPPTMAQVLMFVNVAKQYKLNPFIREIYAFPKDGAIVPVVPIDGWVTLTQRQKHYDGHKFEYEWQDGKVGGALLSAKCIIYRKDTSHPIEHTEYMIECVKDTSVWKKWPRRMLTHKAFSQCARYAFGLSGIYDEDEAERIMQADGSEVMPPKKAAIEMPQRASEKKKDAPPVINAETKANPPKQEPKKEAPKQEPPKEEPPHEDQLGDDIPFEGDERREPPQRQGGILQGMNPYAEPGQEYIEHLAGVVEGTQQPVEVSEATKTIAQMFEEGTVKRARDLPPSEVKKAGTIGKQKAMSLHIRITQGKKRTEAELQEEILKPLGLEHLRDLPLKMLSQVERWIDGADIGAEYDERQKKQ